jgi:hypothetical protein
MRVDPGIVAWPVTLQAIRECRPDRLTRIWRHDVDGDGTALSLQQHGLRAQTRLRRHTRQHDALAYRSGASSLARAYWPGQQSDSLHQHHALRGRDLGQSLASAHAATQPRLTRIATGDAPAAPSAWSDAPLPVSINSGINT